MDNLGFMEDEIVLIHQQPKMQCNVSPTAKECTELVIFREIRAKSAARTVLEISNKDVDVSH